MRTLFQFLVLFSSCKNQFSYEYFFLGPYFARLVLPFKEVRHNNSKMEFLLGHRSCCSQPSSEVVVFSSNSLQLPEFYSCLIQIPYQIIKFLFQTKNANPAPASIFTTRASSLQIALYLWYRWWKCPLSSYLSSCRSWIVHFTCFCGYRSPGDSRIQIRMILTLLA
jgi:hypothetical protein